CCKRRPRPPPRRYSNARRRRSSRRGSPPRRAPQSAGSSASGAASRAACQVADWARGSSGLSLPVRTSHDGRGRVCWQPARRPRHTTENVQRRRGLLSNFRRCMRTSVYLPSYVEWLTCLEMARVDLLVELVDDLGGRFSLRPQAERAGELLSGDGGPRRREMGMPRAPPPRVRLRCFSAEKLPRKTATKRAQEKRIGRNHDVHAPARGAGPRRVYPGS